MIKFSAIYQVVRFPVVWVILVFFVGLLIGLGMGPFLPVATSKSLLSPTAEIYASSYLDREFITNSTEFTSLESMMDQFDLEQLELIEVEPQLGHELDGRKTIALIGDSMIDTMGTSAPYLQSVLGLYYPNMEFEIFNYGIGGENIMSIMKRLDQPFSYKDRSYPPIVELDADLIIVGSAAYNPTESIEEYSETLRSVLDQVVALGTPVVFLATIAPLKDQFGVGPGGVNWPTEIATEHATRIQLFMEQAIENANSRGLPVIDVYHQTLHDDGEGVAELVNSHDGIHPSIKGHEVLATEIARYIAESGLF